MRKKKKKKKKWRRRRRKIMLLTKELTKRIIKLNGKLSRQLKLKRFHPFIAVVGGQRSVDMREIERKEQVLY